MLDKLIEAFREGIFLQQHPLASVAGEINASSTEAQRRLLAILATKPELTVAELVDELALRRRTIERSIKALRDGGQLRRIGATKKGFWQLT